MSENKYLPEGKLIGTSKNTEYISSIYGLEKAKAEGRILEAIVTVCDSDTYDLHVDLYGIDGIIKREECLYSEDLKDIAIITRVGKPVVFKVMQIVREEDKKPYVILSRKEAQRECMENYLMTLIPGDIIPAKVTHMESFGAFVDIGCGIISLMSVDCISVSRISNPTDRFYIREEIKAVVKSIDYKTGRIYVSERELLGTWEENVSMFAVGQTVSGIVRGIEDYGIFIELAPNLAGLAEVKEKLRIGQTCAVYIKNIIPEKMKIKLVIIDTCEAQSQPKKPKYFINTEEVTHIDSWHYSPYSCAKTIETDFSK